MRPTVLMLLIGMLLVMTGCPVTKMPAPRAVYEGEPRSRPMGIEAFVHEQSGIVFPSKVPGLSSEEITEYDRDGYDISVGYDRTPPDGLASYTIYVYPGPASIRIGAAREVVDSQSRRYAEGHLQYVAEELEHHEPSWKRTNEGPESYLPLSSPGGFVSYAYTRPGFIRVPMKSEAHVFVANDRWFFKVRSTYPENEEESAREGLVSLIEAVKDASGGKLK